MSDYPTSDPNADRLARYVLGRFDVPAYVKRDRTASDAYEQLLDDCRRRRARMLAPVRDALARLRSAAPDPAGLSGWLAGGDQLVTLAELEEAVGPVRPLPTRASSRAQRRALADLGGAVARFNADWAEFLARLDLTAVNAAREAYNRYYVFEKECALRSPALARAGFRPLPSVTADDLVREFPPLPVPRLAV